MPYVLRMFFYIFKGLLKQTTATKKRKKASENVRQKVYVAFKAQNVYFLILCRKIC